MGAYLEHFSSTTHRGLGNQEISESAASPFSPPPPPPPYNHLWTTTRGSRIKYSEWGPLTHCPFRDKPTAPAAPTAPTAPAAPTHSDAWCTATRLWPSRTRKTGASRLFCLISFERSRTSPYFFKRLFTYQRNWCKSDIFTNNYSKKQGNTFALDWLVKCPTCASFSGAWI